MPFWCSFAVKKGSFIKKDTRSTRHCIVIVISILFDHALWPSDLDLYCMFIDFDMIQ